MPTLLTRRGAILAKLEGVGNEGIDSVPVAADGVLVEQPVRVTFNPNVIDTTELNPSLDPFDPIVGGTSCTIEFDLYIKGHPTPPTAPEWGRLLVACGFAETISSAAVPVTPAACAAGGTTILAVLGTAAAATAQLYRGMPLLLSSANTLETFIYDYTAAKAAKLTNTSGANIVATTMYQIPANIRYVPATTSQNSLTIYFYNDGVLYKFLGCRGTCPLTITSGGPARFSFRFMGMYGGKIDAALPAAVYDATRPPIWKGGSFTINSADAAGQTMSIDPGNNLVTPDNPNSDESFDPAIITARNIRGNVNPKETLVATRDAMGDFRNSTKRPLHARLGSVVWNRVGITIPSAMYLNHSPQDTNGYVTVDVPFHATIQDGAYSVTIY